MTSIGATVAPGTYSRADSSGILSRRKATPWKSAGTFTYSVSNAIQRIEARTDDLRRALACLERSLD